MPRDESRLEAADLRSLSPDEVERLSKRLEAWLRPMAGVKRAAAGEEPLSASELENEL